MSKTEIALDERDELRQAMQWLAGDNTGVSSKTIVYAYFGIKPSRDYFNYPHDPSDFNRCLQMLKQCPFVRPGIDKLAKKDPVWAALRDRWDEIEKCFIDEVGDNWTLGTRASKTYALMQAIIEPIEKKAGE